jgi:multicomponent Na+:H+ antiporter subunit C
MNILVLAFTTTAIVLIVNLVIATYGIFTDRSLLKKVISLFIFSDTLSVFAILIGFRIPKITSFPRQPIYLDIPNTVKDIEEFLARTVDPIPQAFIITAIVINLAVFSFLAGLLLQYYKHFGSLDVHALEEEEVIDEVY